MYLPVGKYISAKRNDPEHTPISCKWTDTLHTVIEKIVQNKVHRVFLVEEQEVGNGVKAIGVISLCDIISVFLDE